MHKLKEVELIHVDVDITVARTGEDYELRSNSEEQNIIQDGYGLCMTRVQHDKGCKILAVVNKNS